MCRALARGEPVRVDRIEREEGAAVLQEHAGIAGHDARPELVIETLDHANGVTLLVGGDERDGVAVGGRPVRWARRTQTDPGPAPGQTRGVETARHRDLRER